MKFDSYQHVGAKTFFINLLKNCAPAIFVFFLFFILIIVKAIGVETFLSFLNTPDLVTFADVALNWAMLATFVFVIILCALGILITAVDYLTFYFKVDEHGLYLKQGLMNKTEITIPYKHMQDINVSQPFIFQILGVCRLNMITAGQDNDHDNDPTEATFPILDKNLAYELRDLFLEHSNVEIEIDKTEK